MNEPITLPCEKAVLISKIKMVLDGSLPNETKSAMIKRIVDQYLECNNPTL